MPKSKRPHLQRWLPVALLAGFVAAVWGLLRRQRPQVESVPVVPPGGVLQIYGRHFGKQSGRLRLQRENQPPIDLEVTHWSPRFISARLPVEVQSGSVEVIPAGWLASQQSGIRSFQRQVKRQTSSYGYRVPVHPEAPWPTFRRDERNSGWSPIKGVYQDDQPWVFQTSKGIFSTPVIDAQGRIYFGSADHNFYALAPDGIPIWRYPTGEIIDSAAALGAPPDSSANFPLTFISGDGCMYQLEANTGRLRWKYQAELRPEISFNRWFEGNVAIGFDGTLYAGNTNFCYYAITPDGQLKWTYNTLGNNWSQAAFNDEGTIYWGSTDTFIRAVSPQGRELWRRRTLGFVAASAALGSDGTVFIGSFDSNFYALDPEKGAVKWKFSTGDHIYSSAALGQDIEGRTNRIYIASTDGFLYALNPQGALYWKFDAGDPIRSSPAVGLSPEGEEIVYVGCGDGRLYAVNGSTGELRWSYNTTPEEPELRDRNDLNGSPALGATGVYIGGEHGGLCYIPYDYPLEHPEDPHCQLASLEEPGDGARLEYVTPGGSSLTTPPEHIPPAPLLTFQLKAWHNGQRVAASICNRPLCPEDALVVESQPPVELRAEVSADGRYLHVLPQTFLASGSQFSLHIRIRYETPARRVGNFTLFGKPAGELETTFTFEVEQPELPDLPLEVGPSHTQAFEWTRLTATFPTMLPSLNQIGFDYLDWIVGTVDRTPADENGRGQVLLWAIGAQRTPGGELVADLTSDFTLPLGGSYQHNSFIVRNRDFHMAITGIDIPFTLFELRGELDRALRVKPGAGAFADTQVLSIPNFGPKMVIAGLANHWFQKLVVAGTYITRPYPAHLTAVQRPSGMRITGLDFRPAGRLHEGWVQATLSSESDSPLNFHAHRFGLLLADAASLEPVALDYHQALSGSEDKSSKLFTIHLRLPRGTRLPRHLKVYVLVDVFPLYSRQIDLG